MNQPEKVRVRIAPSPTGDPHVGTAYTALFNYVFAKKNQGSFILRIEDTDRGRSKPSSEQQIFETLNWLGLTWDEGPDVGGSYGPYRQSERFAIYKKHADQLLSSNHAYRCFCSKDQLDEARQKRKEQGLPPGYDRRCRDLAKAAVEANLKKQLPYVIRLKMPIDGSTKFCDHIRGEIEISNTQIDDQVLIKSDGFPTYHLANVVDDHLMKITHVIRAEEWISSTPKHVVLYESFGWQAPRWVHLPLLRNSDHSKISKRKNPTSLFYYQRAGILPQALLNFLALMGWSYGNDVELFSLAAMIEKFDIKGISPSGPVFDQVKLSWLNQQYIQKMTDEQFVDYLHNTLFSKPYLKQLKPLLAERISRFEQFVDKAAFFFNGALNYEQVDLIPKGMEKPEVRNMVKGLLELLDELYQWNTPALEALLSAHKEQIGWKPKDYFMTLRLILTGRTDSPPLVETMTVLGREIVRFRLRDVLSNALK